MEALIEDSRKTALIDFTATRLSWIRDDRSATFFRRNSECRIFLGSQSPDSIEPLAERPDPVDGCPRSAAAHDAGNVGLRRRAA